jgi:hypothetical protein
MKRILEDIELEKIAAVDKPAQEHAVVTIMKRAPSTAISFDEALVLTKAKQKQNVDPDNDGSIDDWSPKGPPQNKRGKKKIRGWSRDDIDAINSVDKRGPLVEHPFIIGARQRAQATGVRLYEAIAAHRRANPQSWKHFHQMQQTQPVPKPMKKAAAPDADVIAWDQALRTFTDQGMSRTDAMVHIRKQAPSLWRRYRR